eukprot:g9190.t1
MYKCPHCPSDPPYAGASGLWYHMKRHHGAVTRPYNSKSRRESRKKAKSGASKDNKKSKKKKVVKKEPKKVEVEEESDESEDSVSDYSEDDLASENQTVTKLINVGELATALKTNNRVKAVLDKAASFDPMLFLSEVAVLQDRVASSEDSGMTTMQAVHKESTDLNTPSPVRPVAQTMLPSADDLLIAQETLMQSSTASINMHVSAGVKRSLQVYNGEEEKKESPKDDWMNKKRKLAGQIRNIQTPTKKEIVFLQGNNTNADNENGESRSPVPTQQQQHNSHRSSPQATTLFSVQHSPPVPAH